MAAEGKRALVKRYVFGASGEGSNSLHWLDDGSLLFQSGKTVVLQAPHSSHQRFLDAMYESSGITAIAMSENKKFVAIAESGENPQIQLIDTVTRKRRKVLSVPDLDSDRYVALCFSQDGRHLVTQGGGPGWNMHYWNWDRSKPLASVSVAQLYESNKEAAAGGASPGHLSPEAGKMSEHLAPAGTAHLRPSFRSRNIVTSIGVCPRDPLLVTVGGVGFLRSYRYTDGLLQPQPTIGIPREPYEIFTTHRWISDRRIVAATKSGNLLLIQDGRYALQIQEASMANTGAMYVSEIVPAITAIVPTRRKGERSDSGFVAGNDHGEVLIFERVGDFGGGGDSASTSPAPEEESHLVEGDIVYHHICTLEVPKFEVGQLPVGPTAAAAGATTAALATDASRKDAEGTASAAGQSGQKEPRLFQLDRSDSKNAAAGSVGPATRAPSQKFVVEDSASPPLDWRGATESPLLTDPEVPPYGITSLALDQAEESLAVITVSGKLYSVNFQQDWAMREKEYGMNVSSSTLVADGAVPSPTVNPLSQRPSVLGLAIPPPLNGIGVAAAASVVPSARSQLFSPMFQLTHHGRINGMSCSVRKPLLITSGSDFSVRVWDTLTGQLVMAQFFKLEPGAVGIHPDGLMAVICFPDKVRVMSVLWNSLRERRSINLRNANDVYFSKGGQFFAIVHNNLVDVMNSNTCELHGQLRGHPQRIKDLQWCSTTPYPTDNRLVTCSADGMMIDWNMIDLRKQAEHSDKRFQYLAVASDDRSVWAVGAPTSAAMLEVSWKVVLREIDRHNLGTVGGGGGAGGSAAGGNSGAAAASGGAGAALQGGGLGSSVGDYEFTETALTRLAVASHQRVLIAGGDDGSVKAITFPLQAGIQEAPLTGHGQSVSRMTLSFDETTVFTSSNDGSIIMWELFPETEKPRQRADHLAADQNAVPPASRDTGGTKAGGTTEEVLVTRQEIEDQNVEAESLEQLIEHMKMDMESEDKRRAHEQGTRARERAEELQRGAVALTAEYGAIWNAKSDQERAFLAVKTEKETEAAHQLEQLERHRQREVDALEDECTKLQQSVEVEKLDHSRLLVQLEETLELEHKYDEEHYADVLSQRKEAVRKLQRQFERSCETNEVTVHQLELDTDAEAQTVFEKQRAALQVGRERFLHLKGEGAVMRKNAVRLEREIEVRIDELQLLESAKVALQVQLNDLTHQVTQLHQDIDERDGIIEKKEKVIYSLKKQNQELEKHKFVLDHHIRQLKGQIEPKQREIVECNNQIKSQNTKLEEQHANNMTLRENTSELKQDIAEQQSVLQAKLRELQQMETYRSRAERDIGELASTLQDPALLANAISHLFDLHVAPRGVERLAPANPCVKQEFQAQIEFLSTSVEALRRKLKADQQRHKTEVSAMMSDNLGLIREIHTLRNEIDGLRSRIAADSSSQKPPKPDKRAKSMRSRSAGSAQSDRAASEVENEQEADGKLRRGTGSSATRRGVDSRQVSVQSDVIATSRRDRQSGLNRRGLSGRSFGAQTPSLPPEIEANRRELRMLRAYIDAMERALHTRPSSASPLSAGQLPPVSSLSNTAP